MTRDLPNNLKWYSILPGPVLLVFTNVIVASVEILVLKLEYAYNFFPINDAANHSRVHWHTRSITPREKLNRASFQNTV